MGARIVEDRGDLRRGREADGGDGEDPGGPSRR